MKFKRFIVQILFFKIVLTTKNQSKKKASMVDTLLKDIKNLSTEIEKIKLMENDNEFKKEN